MSEAKPKSLVAKLAEVMAEVDRVKKTGRNAFHGYDYATEADIVSSVRQGMASRQVMLFNNPVEVVWGSLQTKSGSQRLCTMKVEFTFEDGESGERRTLFAYGEGSDAGDKAMYKALTGAVKYVLLKTFLIPTGDDPEDDTPVRVPTSGQRTTQASAHTASAPAAVHAQAVKQQLKRGLNLTDVQTGETEAEAKAREAAKPSELEKQLADSIKAQAAKKAEPTPYERICILFDEYGLAEKTRKSFIKGATAKESSGALTVEDIALVRGALEQRRHAEAREAAHAANPL